MTSLIGWKTPRSRSPATLIPVKGTTQKRTWKSRLLAQQKRGARDGSAESYLPLVGPACEGGGPLGKGASPSNSIAAAEGLRHHHWRSRCCRQRCEAGRQGSPAIWWEDVPSCTGQTSSDAPGSEAALWRGSSSRKTTAAKEQQEKKGLSSSSSRQTILNLPPHQAGHTLKMTVILVRGDHPNS